MCARKLSFVSANFFLSLFDGSRLCWPDRRHDCQYHRRYRRCGDGGLYDIVLM